MCVVWCSVLHTGYDLTEADHGLIMYVVWSSVVHTRYDLTEAETSITKTGCDLTALLHADTNSMDTIFCFH